MKTMNPIVTLSLLMLLSCTTLHAQDEEEPIKAITPEVQTADWAKDWWMPRHEAKLAELEEFERVDLLMIGDSITHGWESGGKNVWDEYYSDRNAFNIGFSGDRTEQVIWRLQHGEVEGIQPKLAVIMIGTNNTGHRKDPPAEIAAGVGGILDELKERLPETKVLLLAIFPRGETAQDGLRLNNDAANELLAKFADNERVFFLDIGHKFLDDEGKLPKSIMPDLLHPNEAGYQIWAESMEASIVKLMED